MSDYSFWTEASRDVEAEETTRRLTAAKVAASSLWPFLAQASDAQEFEMRLDLAMDRLAALASGDDLTLLVEALRDDYEAFSRDFNPGQREVAASLSVTAEGLMPSGVEDEATAESNVDPQGGLDRMAQPDTTLHMGRLALLKITTAAGDAYVIVDEESGYKVGGPFKSHSDAAAVLSSGKFKGRSVKIEKRGEGEKDKKKENGNKRRDDSGGSNPYREKGGAQPRKVGSVPGAPAGPEMGQEAPQDGSDAPADPGLGGDAQGDPTDPGMGGGGNGIPMSTKPRQMPGGSGGADQMNGVDPLGMGEAPGGDEGGAANEESGGASQDTMPPSMAVKIIQMASYISSSNPGMSEDEAVMLAQRFAAGGGFGMAPKQPNGPVTDAFKSAPGKAGDAVFNHYYPRKADGTTPGLMDALKQKFTPPAPPKPPAPQGKSPNGGWTPPSGPGVANPGGAPKPFNHVRDLAEKGLKAGEAAAPEVEELAPLLLAKKERR